MLARLLRRFQEQRLLPLRRHAREDRPDELEVELQQVEQISQQLTQQMASMGGMQTDSQAGVSMM